jgi:drug/metabolite transporter (DMT)-like permease
MVSLVAKRIGLTTVNTGWVALLATLVIWASYFIVLRSGVQSSLTTFDMVLLRFILPGTILAPLILQRWEMIKRVKKRYLFGIMLGAGLPFFLLSVLASGHVQAVVGSLLVPGLAPVFVTLIAVFFYRERLSKRRLFGLSAVLVGIGVLVSSHLSASNEQAYLGSLLYIMAAGCWAIYTVSVKLSKLSGLEIAAVLNTTAALTLLALLPFDIFPSNLAHSHWQQVLPQLIVLGVFSGFVSVITYGHAIKQLGAELSACWGATTPVLVAVLAYLVLGESLNLTTMAAMTVIIAGVVVANLKSRPNG